MPCGRNGQTIVTIEAKLIETLAACVVASQSAVVERSSLDTVRAHVFDTLGAMCAGLQTSEGYVTRRAFAGLYSGDQLNGVALSPGYLAAVMSACARLTEADDIHIQSCTTPGSVVVPAALAATAVMAGSSKKLGPDDFSAAIIAGYDVMVTLGLAIDGSRVVYDRTWPTYLGASITAAATAGRILQLDENGLRHAIAIAATMTTGTAGRIRTDPSSRWLTLGCALQSGLTAAIAAGGGIMGDTDIFEHYRDAFGLVRAAHKITFGAAITETELKPYCTGRQSLSATQAFSTLLSDEEIEPSAIRHVEVKVPAQVRSMVDRSARPKIKPESRGIRYQLALAAFHPDELLDIERGKLRSSDPDMCYLMDRIEVVADDRLTAFYPQAWGGAVSINTGAETYVREVFHPIGSPLHSMTFDNLIAKFQSMSNFFIRPIPTDALGEVARTLDANAALMLFRNWHEAVACSAVKAG
jgi:2-methylcitrate dehydratase PrpD